MNYDELSALIGREVDNAVGAGDSKLSDARREAMDYYLGEPFGNEVEGRSSFVSRDVADTVEGILPSIMRIFTSQDEVVRFEPTTLQDEQGAQAATDYVNYTFTRATNGFVVLYTFFKDALLQKNGFCKVYWDDTPVKTVEEYENQPPEVLQAIAMQLQQEGLQVELGDSYENRTTLEITDTSGKLCIDPIPPEEIRVNKNANWDLQKCRFVAHERIMTASELREMDIDPEGLPAYPDLDSNSERLARFQSDQSDFLSEDAGHEPNREYLVRECYMLVDWDGDGVAERRQILSCGKVLRKTSGEWCNWAIDRVPIVTTTPILMPHKLFGLSIADQVSDLQLLKSTVLRQILDNMYLSNNSRMAVLDGMVNIDDLLTVRPGGIVRMKTFDAVKPMQVPFFGAPAFQMLGYVDQIREVRSGQRHFQGVDPDAISKDISGVALDKFAQASMEKIELIARIFAETGVKEMMWSIFALIQRNVKRAQLVKLRGQWTQIDPRAWSNKYHMSVNVGLGTGSKDQLLRGAQLIGQIQLQIAQSPMMGRVVTEQNIYNYAHEVASAVMPKKGDLFFTDPSSLGPPQQKPTIDEQKLQVAAQKAQMADKSKRDISAVQFLTEVAKIRAQPPGPLPPPDPAIEGESKRAFDAISQKAKQDHELQMQREKMVPEQQQVEISRMDSQKTDQVMQLIQQQAQMIQQLQQTQEHMAKIMSAPKKLITDANGEPIGVEPVLDQKAAA